MWAQICQICAPFAKRPLPQKVLNIVSAKVWQKIRATMLMKSTLGVHRCNLQEWSYFLCAANFDLMLSLPLAKKYIENNWTNQYFNDFIGKPNQMEYNSRHFIVSLIQNISQRLISDNAHYTKSCSRSSITFKMTIKLYRSFFVATFYKKIYCVSIGRNLFVIFHWDHWKN
jgi:hypothetical protein